MLVGLGMALCFRRGAGETELTIPVQGESLAVGKQALPRNIVAVRPAGGSPVPAPRPHSVPVEAAGGSRQLSPTVVTPSDQVAPPPEFPKSYPGGNFPASARWGASMAQMLPERAGAPPASPPTHKIVDGDTLPLLAERYLGSSSRAMEIYEANRNVLAEGPDLLPVDKVLKIPRNEQASSGR